MSARASPPPNPLQTHVLFSEIVRSKSEMAMCMEDGVVYAAADQPPEVWSALAEDWNSML